MLFLPFLMLIKVDDLPWEIVNATWLQGEEIHQKGIYKEGQRLFARYCEKEPGYVYKQSQDTYINIHGWMDSYRQTDSLTDGRTYRHTWIGKLVVVDTLPVLL